MKTISVGLEAAISGELTTICRLWRIEARGREPLLFTDHDSDVFYGAENYTSNLSFEASAVQNTINSAAANLEVHVLLGDGLISYQDLVRGIYDSATVTLSIVSFGNLGATELVIFKGMCKNVSLPTKKHAVLNLAGNMGKVTKQVGEKYSLTCRAYFGDARCGVSLPLFQSEVSVTGVANPQSFSISGGDGAAGAYDFGVIEWLTGNNRGVATEIAQSSGGSITTFFRTPYPVEIGDTGMITRGCPKTVAACISYNNLENYRGEPYVPGDIDTGS